MPLNYQQVLDALKDAGNEQTREAHRLRGASPNLFGVSTADLARLKAEVGVNHEIARRLWSTGNEDARIFATMVADVAALLPDEAERWVVSERWHVVLDAFGDLVARTEYARDKALAWIDSEDERMGRAGWRVIAALAGSKNKIDDEFFGGLLRRIVPGIHGAPNGVRDAMNNALIAIGVRNAALEKLAVAAAKKIGKVHVEHADPKAVTPDAAEYIATVSAYRSKKPAAKGKAPANGAAKAGASAKGKKTQTPSRQVKARG